MRIDYSEPKRSYTSTPPLASQNRPRKESSGSKLFVIVSTSVLSLAIGFCSGWMFSQQSAKKGFKAAMEQQSLENSPNKTVAGPSSSKSAATATQAPPHQQTQTGGAQSQPAQAGVQTTVEQPLSFYKTLPSGQKNNVLGSGINTYDRPAKHPLQAAIPANVTKPSQPQNAEEPHKPAPENSGVKTAARQEASSSFAVQVASYSLKSEAETVRDKLSGKGYNVYIKESHLGDKGTWYRVRVGKRLDQDAARELAEKFGKGAMAVPEKE